MELYNSFAIIIVLAALFGYVNFRFLKFPNTIGVMIIALVGSLVIVLLGNVYPKIFSHTIRLINTVDFYTVLNAALYQYEIHQHPAFVATGLPNYRHQFSKKNLLLFNAYF